MKRRDLFKLPALGVVALGNQRIERTLFGSIDLAENGSSIIDAKTFEQKFHPDYINYLPGVEYFLIGNGDIQAVLQFYPQGAKDGSGTFLGFTLMDPERYSRKASTLYYHPEKGFSSSMISVAIDGKGFSAQPENFISIEWKYIERVPILSLKWYANDVEIEEELFVPNEGAFLFRRIKISNRGQKNYSIEVTTYPYPNFFLFDEIYVDGSSKQVLYNGYLPMSLLSPDKNLKVQGRYELRNLVGEVAIDETKQATYVYSIHDGKNDFKKKRIESIWSGTSTYWKDKNSFDCKNKILNHLFDVSRTLIKAQLSRTGKRDSGIWQYNMEWVRDDSMTVMGLLQAGFFKEAKILLEKLVTKSIGENGCTIEASRWMGYDYTEIDQNGQLPYVIWMYVCWTGDVNFVKKYWKKIILVTEFTLLDVFKSKSVNLLRNKREFWERSDGFGVEDGFELAYQFWVMIGLEKAALLARLMNENTYEKKWSDAALELKQIILEHPKYKFIEDGHLIKRRTLDGRWQKVMIPPDPKRMPQGSPISIESKPSCEPDTCIVYPIIYELIDPKSDVATKTLEWIEQLWNQRWDFGGYSRYNVESEPDPPAPWPLVTTFMARAYIENGNDEKVWRNLNWLYNINGGKSGGWFERYGPSITPPAPPVGIVGWTWAEIIGLVVHHILGIQPQMDSITIRPKLIRGIDEMNAKIKVRECVIHLTITRSPDKSSAKVNGKEVAIKNGAIELAHQKGNIEIEIGLYNQ